MTLKTLNANGVEVPHTITGKGPLVVLRHAYGVMAWGDVSTLAEHCTVVITDWTESPMFPAPPGYDWFGPLVSTLGFERGALVAWSLAGPTAVRFAATNSPSLSSFVIVDCAGLDDAPSVKIEIAPENPTPEFLQEDRRRRSSGRGRPRIDITGLNELHNRLMSQPGALRRNSIAERRALTSPPLEALSQIKVPTLILAGSESDVLPLRAAEATAERIPNSRLVVFEGCTHLLQLEEPIRFQQEVARFVTSVEAGDETPRR